MRIQSPRPANSKAFELVEARNDRFDHPADAPEVQNEPTGIYRFPRLLSDPDTEAVEADRGPVDREQLREQQTVEAPIRAEPAVRLTGSVGSESERAATGRSF